MATECALKAHAIMGRRNESIDDVYREIRRRRHDIRTLCEYATYLGDRALYDALSQRLGPFSVFARYSLDAYETFFPSLMERDQAAIDHRRTIGSNPWVLQTRALVNDLQEVVQGEFQVMVTDDLVELLDHEAQMKAFADRHIRR